MSSTDSCTRKKWDVKMALNGLHLRRAELARDCVQKNIKDASISESILGDDECVPSFIPKPNFQLKKCHAIHAKFPFAPGSKRKKRSSKGSGKSASKRKASICRKDTKVWHKQCSELAKCCPLAEEWV
ncbi:unnamed protein product [Heligmosomoides polygyrus]|uniref:Uncharacterized protein n=1 Tax=Heligmosomoides polygyrus TaxID=6339 RepID=A0A183G4L9_HELPZ|nr:unnamed protein product [Heligmosomoides polygyrus]